MIFIILAVLLYALAILFGAAASRNANTNLAAAITNVVSAIVPLSVTIPLFTRKSLMSQRFGVVMAVFGGVTIALFAMTMNKSLSQNKVGVVAPIVFGGAIALSTILSYFIFKERLTLLQTVGVLIILSGLGLLIYARATGR